MAGGLGAVGLGGGGMGAGVWGQEVRALWRGGGGELGGGGLGWGEEGVGVWAGGGLRAGDFGDGGHGDSLIILPFVYHTILGCGIPLGSHMNSASSPIVMFLFVRSLPFLKYGAAVTRRGHRTLREQNAPGTERSGNRTLREQNAPGTERSGNRTLREQNAPGTERSGNRTLREQNAPGTELAGNRMLREQNAPGTERSGNRTLREQNSPGTERSGNRTLREQNAPGTERHDERLTLDSEVEVDDRVAPRVDSLTGVPAAVVHLHVRDHELVRRVVIVTRARHRLAVGALPADVRRRAAHSIAQIPNQSAAKGRSPPTRFLVVFSPRPSRSFSSTFSTFSSHGQLLR